MNSHESSMGASQASQCERAPQDGVGKGVQPITKYRTGRFQAVPIEAVEVERETDSSVWVRETWRGERSKPRRRSKRSDWDNYFDTWGEAHAFLLGRAEATLTSARRQLAVAQGEYGNVKGMKEPK